MLLEWLLEVWKKLLSTLTKNTRISMTYGERRDQKVQRRVMPEWIYYEKQKTYVLTMFHLRVHEITHLPEQYRMN